MTEQLRQPTLLVVSDSPSIFQWMKKSLEDRFYLLEATTVQIAIETARGTKLNFIILDSLFEECDSLALSHKLRQIDPTVPIFLITSRLKKSFRKAAIDSGITDFLNDQLSVEEIEMRTTVSQKTATMSKKTAQMSQQITRSKQPPISDFFKNRMLLNEKALRLLAEMKKKKDAVTLLLIRLDHFDELQNTEGLMMIQEILLPLQERMGLCLRPDDLLIPAAHGLFILLLPHTIVPSAYETAEKLRRSVQQTAFDLSKKSVHLTISIVVSPLEASEEQYKKMVSLASQTLDEEKNMTNLILSLGH